MQQLVLLSHVCQKGYISVSQGIMLKLIRVYHICSPNKRLSAAALCVFCLHSSPHTDWTCFCQADFFHQASL